MNSKWHRVIFWVVYLAYTSIYIARVNLSIAGPEMMDANILDTVQIGILGSVFSTVYALGRLVNGRAADKNPPWLMLTVGLALAGISNILIGFFPPFVGIFLLWTTNAFAQSMLWSSVLCVVSSMYEGEIAKKKTSLMVTSVAMGNILAIILNTFFITRFGARFAFIIPGLLTIALGVAVFFATRKISIMPKLSKKHISMWELFKNKELLKMSVPAMMHGVMKENISLWMAVYIVDKYMVDLSTSSYYVLLIPVIGFVGRMLYPLFLNICKGRENSVSLIGFVICVISAALLSIDCVGMVGAVLCLSFIYAAVSMINTSLLSIYPLYYTKSGNVASVSGIMDFGTYLGGGVASAIYGSLIKSFGYVPMFVSWILISVVSIFVIIKINQDRKKNNALSECAAVQG